MKRYIRPTKSVAVFLGTIAILVFNGCSSKDAATSSQVLQSDNESSLYISQATAIDIATDELLSSIDLSQTDLWSENSKVVAAYPIYKEGKDDVAYYECKIQTDGEDAGYVLVNANKTDIIVAESANNGSTLTEQYREKLNQDDLTVIRYDWFHSVAMQGGNIVASTGFNDDAFISTAPVEVEKMTNLRSAPSLNQDDLNSYYAEMEEEGLADSTGDESDLRRRRRRPKHRNIYAQLRNRFPNNHFTPRYKQFKKSNGHSIGCGNTAWAIVYGYWNAFHNKKNLFNRHDIKNNAQWNDSYDPQVKDCMYKTARFTGTIDVLPRTKKFGMTRPSQLPKGAFYAKSKGYRGTSCRKHNGREYSKFDHAYNSLRGNKPCMLLMHSDGKGIVNHYVVIEAANKSQRRYIRRWRNRDVRYLVNYGGGKASKWIHVRDWGRNQHKVYTATSLYTVDVK